MRRVTCRALYSAMSSGARFRDDVPDRIFALQSMRDRAVRDTFPRFIAPHAMADLAMAVVSVSSARTKLGDAVSVLGKSVGPVHLVSRASRHAVVSL